MTVYRELIIPVRTDRFMIRLWVDNNKMVHRDEIEMMRLAAIGRSADGWRPERIADTLIALDKVNAVEVRPHDDQPGVVVYKDWP